jgi:hypothetical protein
VNDEPDVEEQETGHERVVGLDTEAMGALESIAGWAMRAG